MAAQRVARAVWSLSSWLSSSSSVGGAVLSATSRVRQSLPRTLCLPTSWTAQLAPQAYSLAGRGITTSSTCSTLAAIKASNSTSNADSSSSSSTGRFSSRDDVAIHGRYEHVKQYILQLAAWSRGNGSSGSVQGVSVKAEVDDSLRQQCCEGDFWLLVECGTWQNHNSGWQGPARALFQVWQLDKGTVVYEAWELSPDWELTGRRFYSASEFGMMTSKARVKKFRTSCQVQLGASYAAAGRTSLGTWLERTFGPGVKFQSKHVNSVRTGNYRPNPKSSWSAPLGSVAMAQAALTGPGNPTRNPNSLAQHNMRHARSSDFLGCGAPRPGPLAAAALGTANAAAAGPSPQYVWPQAAAVLPLERMYAPGKAKKVPSWQHGRNNLLRAILEGKEDLQLTHVPLQHLHPDLPPPSEASALSTSSSSSSSRTTAASGSPQVYGLLELERHSAEAAAPSRPAVVPDASRPFTIYMNNTADGQDYVVAHYEPHALSYKTAEKAALLCELYHNKGPKITRGSAPKHERMAMAGMRVPPTGVTGPVSHYGRYSGDEGPEADQFSLTCWPYLATTGGFRAISDHWMNTLPGAVCSLNQEAAQVATADHKPKGLWMKRNGPPANYPAPSLYGSPFTTLAITQNYFSLLHCEPEEHPFSFITWLDVLGAGSKMEVGHFWLTAALAFAPLSGSALYIDVRLVTHCSDTCTVRHGADFEGRYGAALFIKPGVLKANTRTWAEFDQYLQLKGDKRLPDDEQGAAAADDDHDDATSAVDANA